MSNVVLWKPNPVPSEGANPEHLQRIRSGVEAWNNWRKEYPEIAPVLRIADLSKTEMSRANLSNVDFGRANLCDANLSYSHLYQAEFFSADLRRANLVGADLRGAKFHNADLSGATLEGADLFRADFIDTRLTGVNFKNARCWTTAFSNVDLSAVEGLSEVNHTGPSSIDISTLFNSGTGIPDMFLRGVGLPDQLIEYLPSLLALAQPIQFYSCFISYSTTDEGFANHLYKRMIDEHLRVWFAPKDIGGGKKLHEQIDSAIRHYDKLLLVLSDSSMQSEWVITEIRNTRRVELLEQKRKLFPI